MDNKNIIGVVLAGGQSSRMGHDKALLNYKGAPLLDHMIGILKRAGINNIYVSGNIDGYRCIKDSAPHEGPAYAMCDVLQQIEPCSGVLFIPVDMPFLSSEMLRFLVNQGEGRYFMGYPLPAFITVSCPKERVKSVKKLLDILDIYPVDLPPELEECMINTNTPEEWDKVLSA